MDYDEAQKCRKELTDIININSPGNRLTPLVDLANKVGASSTRFGRSIPSDPNDVPRNIISESEIVNNIHVAIQTVSMLETCKTASNSYKIAIWAAIIAFISALAAWAGVILIGLIDAEK